jgi:hypothetical protein
MKSFFTIFISGFGVNRSWVGVGAGGGGNDFNAAANWSPSGVPTGADDLTIAFTSSATIQITGNITVNSCSITVSGNRLGQLDFNGNTLTVNNTFYTNANNYSNPANYDQFNLNLGTGNLVIGGNATFQPTGSGDTYIYAATTGPGTITFNGAAITFGRWCRTAPGVEPNMTFDRNGSQTVNIKTTSYHVKGETLTFGLSNAPTVSIIGVGSVRFQPYDGNLNIGANTTVLVRDTAVVNYTSGLDRYVTGGGTMTMGANSLLRTGCPNDWALIGGYATYSHNATSTVHYNSTGWQALQPITYGNLIMDGAGNSGGPWKYSQGAATVQGNCTIQSFAIFGPWVAGGITVIGNTLIQSSGVFNATRNNAVANITHTFKGDFTNNSSFTSGTTVGINTALFDGTGNQTIGGTVSTNFYHCTVNKTSGTLFLGINTTVGLTNVGVMNFQNGPMNLNGFTLIIDNPATGAVTRTNGYAISEQTNNSSKIQWNMGSTTGAHEFPFGTTGGVYIPVTFDLTAGTVGNVTISTYPTAASNLPWPTTPTNVTNLNSTTGLLPDNRDATADRFWQIDKTGASGTATVTFSARTAELPIAPYNVVANQRMQRYNSTVNKWEPALGGQTTGTITGGFTVTVPGITTFSPWAMASSLSPLPIELTEFSVNCNQNGTAMINFTTASQTNNDYFTIERSADGDIFSPIGTIDGAGNSSQSLSYSFIDQQPLNQSWSYYRLKQTDFDGKFSLSDVRSLHQCNGSAGSLISVSYGPNATLTVSVYSGVDQPGNIRVLDITGREIQGVNTRLQEGMNVFNLDLSKEGPGIYLLNILNGKETTVKRVVIH